MSFANFSHVFFFPEKGNKRSTDAYDFVMFLDLLQLCPEGKKMELKSSDFIR